jgi:hypothetical protein
MLIPAVAGVRAVALVAALEVVAAGVGPVVVWDWGEGVASLPQAASNRTSGIKNKTNFLSFKLLISPSFKGLLQDSSSPEPNCKQPYKLPQ